MTRNANAATVSTVQSVHAHLEGVIWVQSQRVDMSQMVDRSWLGLSQWEDLPRCVGDDHLHLIAGAANVGPKHDTVRSVLVQLGHLAGQQRDTSTTAERTIGNASALFSAFHMMIQAGSTCPETAASCRHRRTAAPAHA